MFQLESMQTNLYDITVAVFDRSKHGVMYVTKDEYEGSYIVAIPAIHFSCEIKTEADYHRILKDVNLIPDRIIRENVVKCMKEAIKEID